MGASTGLMGGVGPVGASTGLMGGVGPLGPPWPLPLGQSSGHPHACLGYSPLGVGPFNVPDSSGVALRLS